MNAESFTNVVSELEGKECWRVVSAWGSFISIDAGTRLANQIGPNRRTVESGEYCVFVQCAQWRLCRASQVLATSLDDLSDGSEAHRNLCSIEGQKIRSTRILNDYFDLAVVFDNGCELIVFCNACNDWASNYSISNFNTSYCVKCDNRVMKVWVEETHDGEEKDNGEKGQTVFPLNGNRK